MAITLREATQRYPAESVSLPELGTFTAANIVVADSAGTLAAVALSGDATISNAGALTIAATSVELGMMAADSVDSDQYVDGSIDLVHMSANSVDSDQYVDNSIDAEHYGLATVNATALAAGAVPGIKLGSSAIIGPHRVSGRNGFGAMTGSGLVAGQRLHGIELLTSGAGIAAGFRPLGDGSGIGEFGAVVTSGGNIQQYSATDYTGHTFRFWVYPAAA